MQKKKIIPIALLAGAMALLPAKKASADTMFETRARMVKASKPMDLSSQVIQAMEMRKKLIESSFDQSIKEKMLEGIRKFGSKNYSLNIGKVPKEFAGIAEKYSFLNGLNPKTIKWLINSESGWNKHAKARTSTAKGLMQVTGTALRDLIKLEQSGELRMLGVPYSLPKRIDLFDPHQNIMIGTAYYKVCIERIRRKMPNTSNSLLEQLAIIAYKEGIGIVL